jgi:hypothetical protein
MRLAGWRLYYEPEMRFKHFIPEGRLKWNYLRRLHRGFGRSKPVLGIYGKAHLGERGAKNHWTRQAMRLLRSILSEHGRTLRRFHLPLEGEREVLALENKIGQLVELLNLRGKLAIIEERISGAHWRRKSATCVSTEHLTHSLQSQQSVALTVGN